MNDGSVIIDVEFNTAKARKQYQEFGNEAAQQLDKTIGNSKAFNSLSDQSVEFAKKASLSILAVGSAVAGFSIKSAADMQAMNAQFSQVFGDLETNAQKSIDSISKETNILPNRLKPAFTSMAAFAKTTGMDTADALVLTSRATKAAADSAAFYDKSIDEVSESLQSYLKGNYENDAALGISSTETTRNAAANKLYGKSFKDLSESQKQLTLLQMVEDGNKLSGALGQAAREGGGLENVMGNMKQAITDLGAAFGAPLLQPFLSIVQKITGAMSSLATAFQKNPALVYAVVGAVTTLAAAFGAVWLKAVGFAKIGSMISTALSVLGSPIFLVVAAIGALVTAFVYFYKTSDTFRSKVDGVVKTLKNFMAPVGDIVKGIKLLAQAFKAIVFNDFSVSVSDLHDQFVKLFPESLWKGMTNFAQSTKGIVQGILTLGEAFKAIAFNELSVSISDLKADFLEVFPESLWNGMTKIATGVRSLIDGFKSGKKSIDPFGIALKVLKAVFLGLLGPIGLFIKAFELIAKALGGGDVSKGIDKIIGGFDSLASGLADNAPKIGSSAGKAIDGILSAIAGALPGIISGGLRIVAAIVSGIAQGLPSIALSASQLILAFTGSMMLLIPQIALSATAIIVALLASLTAGLPQIIVAGGALILALLDGITQQIPAFIESTATLIVTWLTSLTAHLPEIVIAGMGLLTAFINGIAQKLPDLVTAVADLIATFLTSLAGKMPSIISAGAELIINFLNGLASKMPDIVSAALNLVVQFINGLASKAGDVVNAGVNLIVQILRGIANNIRRIVDAGMDIVDATVEGVIDAQDRLFKAAIRLVNGMADNIRNNRDEMNKAGKNLLDAIIEGIPGNGLVSAGFDLIMGLAEGIGNAASSAVTAAKNVASSILDKVTGFFDIHSPSRVMRDEVGRYLPEGIAVGIDKGAKKALNSMDSLSKDLLDSASGDFVNQIPAMKALMSGSLKPEQTSTVLAGVNKSVNQAKATRNLTDSTSLLAGLTDAIDKLANRPVEASFKIGEREIVRAIAQPINQEILRIQRRQKRSQEGIT